MSLIQILLILFILFAILITIKKFLRKDIRIFTTVFWVIFWLIGLVIVIYPDSTYFVSNFLGIGRGADLVVYISLVLIFFMIFKILIEQEKQRREITKLTRILAINDKNYGER